MRKAMDGVILGVFLNVFMREVLQRWYPDTARTAEQLARSFLARLVAGVIEADTALEVDS